MLSHRTKSVVISYRQDVAALLPEAQRINNHLIVNHGVEETRLLRNFGIDVPAPILTHYEWAGTRPFESQRTTAAMFSTSPRAYCLSEMGVGKSRAGLYAFDFLRQEGVARKLLIIAPLSTLVDVWEREIFASFYHLNCAVLHGTREQRLISLSRDVDIYIINPDGLKIIGTELINKRFDVIIIDELAEYRNANTDRWKAANAVVNSTVWLPHFVWGLTGSPTPNGPTDAFGQVRLLTPENIVRSFRTFQRQIMHQISTFKWLPRPEANDLIAAAMKPSVRFAITEHDLPETTYSTRHAELTATQRRLYEQMLRHFKMELAGQQIVALNEGVKLTKLLQISCGFAYTKDKGVHINAKDRMKLVLELIEQSERKVIVFASFKWVARALMTVIESRYSVAAVTGDTSKGDRDKTFAAFRNGDLHVIVAHPKVAAHGLDLTAATTIIWYGPTNSTELYMQANARVKRPGQTCKTHIIHIESTPIEKRVFNRLQRNEGLLGVLLELFQGAQDE